MEVRTGLHHTDDLRVLSFMMSSSETPGGGQYIHRGPIFETCSAPGGGGWGRRGRRMRASRIMHALSGLRGWLGIAARGPAGDGLGTSWGLAWMRLREPTGREVVHFSAPPTCSCC